MERSLGASAVGLLPSAPGSHDTCDRPLRGDDIVAELARGLHPRERPDWEETISAMARSAEVPDLRTSNSASMKVKGVKKLSFSKGHFPKLAECAHFHYENVDFGNLQLSLAEEHSEGTRNGLESKECVYLVQIHCQGRNWIVRRSYEDFRILDKHLHLCIYDRRYSQLPELPREQPEVQAIFQMLIGYLTRLSAIADNKINCGPALTWMELDNKGNHLLVHEESSINVPAIAAAHVIKRYNAQAADELSFEVGDIVSVIDMPPKEDTTWWRGKHGFQVGFFPSECVELINDKIPQSVTNCVPKPDLEMETIRQQDTNMNSVSKKHGKLITFLRSFMKSRPSKQKLKQRGILKERVFGCDLGEHLLNSGQDVPQVLRSCAEFIEKHGIVDGIYRLSGIASNIQKLRHEFDSELIPDLTKEVYLQDIHCVGSLCKLYFRELPNPLLTYQLYDKFSEAVSAATDDERLVKVHDVIQQLPPPHYRTLEFLMKHLARLAAFCSITNMHAKNLAIVWAPNLLRSRQIESACFGGPAAFMEVRIQSVVVEFILSHVDVLFGPRLAGHGVMSRPKSLLMGVGGSCARLLSLEEAQARTQAQISSPVTPHSRYIEVGEGPAALLGKFHTVIDFPTERKRAPIKSRKSPVGSWRSFFSLGKSSSSSSSSSSAVNKRKLRRNPSEPSELKSMALPGGRGETGTLRSAKSEESLTSLHNVEGESKLYRPRRPRSSSDALSPSFGADLLGGSQHCASYDNLCQADDPSHHHHNTQHQDDSDLDDRPIFCVPALISSPPPTVSTAAVSAETDLELLMPPEVGMATLDFDPMSFGLGSPLASEQEKTFVSTATEKIGQEIRSGTDSRSPDRSQAVADLSLAGLHTASSSFSIPDGSIIMTLPSSVQTPPMSPPHPISSRVESVRNEALWLDLQGSSPLHTATTETVTIDSDVSQQPADLNQLTSQSEIQNPLTPSSPVEPTPAPRKLVLVLDSPAQTVTAETSRSCDPPSPLSPLRADDLLSSLDWPLPTSLTGAEAIHQEPNVTTAALSPAPIPASIPSSPLRTSSSCSPVRVPIKPDPSPATPPELAAPSTPDIKPDAHGDQSAPLADKSTIIQQDATAKAEQVQAVAIPPAQATPVCHQAVPATSQPDQVSPACAKISPTIAQALPLHHQTTPTVTTAIETCPTQATPTPIKIKSVPATSLPGPSPSSPQQRPADMDSTLASSAVDPITTPTAAAVDPVPVPASDNDPASGKPPAPVTGITALASSTINQEQGGVPTRGSEPQQVSPLRSHPHGRLKPTEQLTQTSRSTEHPVAVLQPQPQTPKPQPCAHVPPPLVEKPWEAIKPVQPRLESGPYQHHPHQQIHSQQPSSGTAPPPPPVRSIESKLATAALSRADRSAYHTFLEEEEEGMAAHLSHSHTLPRKSAYIYHGQGEHVLLEPALDAYYPPHARAMPHSGAPSSHSYHYRGEAYPLAYASDVVSRYATIGPRSYHHSLKSHHRPARSDYLPSLGLAIGPGPVSHHRAHGYTSHPTSAYPSIRRVHSLHGPSTPSSSSLARGPPISRAEIPPPVDEEMYYYQQRSAHRCRAPPAPGPQESQDYHVTRLQPFFENGRVQYRYSPYGPDQHTLDASYYDLDPYATVRLRHAHTFGGRDRDIGSGGGKSGAYHYLLHQRHSPHPHHVHHHHHPLHSMSPHGESVKEHGFVSHDVPPAHLHSAAGSTKGASMSQAMDPQEAEPHLHGHSHSLRRESRARQRLRGPVLSQYDNIGPLSSDPQGAPSDSLQHLRSKSDPGKEARYNVTPETALPRSLTDDPSALYLETEKHGNLHPVPRPSGQRSYPSSQPHSLPYLPEASRSSEPHEVTGRGGRSPDDTLQKTVTMKPDRCHSRGPIARHPSSATQSHYDNLDEYRSPPRPTQDPLASRGGAAIFPGQAFAASNSTRAYSTALGQGAYIQTEHSMQRPEAQVKVE